MASEKEKEEEEKNLRSQFSDKLVKSVYFRLFVEHVNENAFPFCEEAATIKRALNEGIKPPAAILSLLTHRSSSKGSHCSY